MMKAARRKPLHRALCGRCLRGISLLEMLVALTILAVSGTILFDWVYQVSTRLQRLNNQQVLALAQLQALQFLRAVNPALTPVGSQKFVDFEMSWSAQPYTPLRAALDASDAPLSRQVGIFDVQVTLLHSNVQQQPWLAFNTQLTGWRQPEIAIPPSFAPGAATGVAP